MTFQLGPALIAGAVAGFIVVFLNIVMLAVAPTRFPANPLYLIGSAITIETTFAYAVGLVLLLLVGTGYGIVTSAMLTGFEVESLEFAWGGITGIALAIVSGTTLGYSRTLSRAVRAGHVGDPGPFLIAYGKTSVAQFLVAHILFGVLAGLLYSALS